MRTVHAKPGEREKKWFVVDAEDEVLGRLASRIALVLRGKHTPAFTPHVDTGDFVVVVNAEKIRLTGAKREAKMYWRHTGYVGGIEGVSAGRMLDTHPERVIYHAVRGMLPHNRLGRQMLKKLKIHVGSEHPHAAQKPVPLEWKKQ